ncbi:restriction endonuclease subunit S [Lacihabitans soyangensis]|nr:restriction endonuclease subunit S [Lacihabitans soyangensis]
MKPYPKYKPTNIDWIGDIPEHWSSRKVAWSFNLIGSGTTPKSDSDLYYENGKHNWLLTGDLTDGEIFETSKKVTDLALKETSSLKKYPKNSIVMAMYGATIGKLGILKIETTTNQACCVLADSPYFDYKYVFYWMLSSRESIINLSYGGGQPNINQDIVKGLKLTYPPLPEQQAIVTYLDQKTALIDELIAKKERKIELLKENRTALINHVVTKGLDPTVKYKDSGIEWIGEIPEHWNVLPLKYFSNITLGKMLTPEDKGDYMLKNYLRSQNIQNEKVNIEDVKQMWFSEKEIENYRLKKFDLLINEGGDVGRTCIWLEELEECYIQNSVNRVKLKDGDPYFFLYHSISHHQNKYYENSVNKVSIPHLTKEKLENIRFVYPPKVEQQQIVKYLDAQTNLIDQNISLELQKIEKLKEYRQSLISNVVTGKICVLED